MKSFRQKNIGSLDYLKMIDEELPEPNEYEVLIKVKACSLNYRDLAILYGTGTLVPKPDIIPVSDGAGEVVKLGKKVETLQLHDRVVSIFFQIGLTED